MGYVKNIYCPKCAAEHELYEIKLISRDKDSEYCDVCGEEIYSWNGACMFQARLVKKNESTCQHKYEMVSFSENEDGEVECKKFKCSVCGQIKEEWNDTL